METGLQLLMGDGAIHLSFRPRLDPAQYAELTRIVDDSITRDDLTKAVKAAADKWGVQCEVENVGL